MALIVWEAVALMFHDAGDRWYMVVDLQVYNSKKIKKICRCKKRIVLRNKNWRKIAWLSWRQFLLIQNRTSKKAKIKYDTNFNIHSGYCLLIWCHDMFLNTRNTNNYGSILSNSNGWLVLDDFWIKVYSAQYSTFKNTVLASISIRKTGHLVRWLPTVTVSKRNYIIAKRCWYQTLTLMNAK